MRWNCQFKDLIVSQTCYFLERHRTCKRYTMRVNWLIFICANDWLWTAEPGHRHIEYGNSYEKDWLACDHFSSSRSVSLTLGLGLSVFPALVFYSMSADSFKPERPLCSLLSVNSHRRITVLFPSFPIFWLIVLGIQENIKFPETIGKDLPINTRLGWAGSAWQVCCRNSHLACFKRQLHGFRRSAPGDPGMDPSPARSCLWDLGQGSLPVWASVGWVEWCLGNNILALWGNSLEG